jgi:hypothetical protein
MLEKQVFFWTLSAVVKPSRSIGFKCQVSGQLSGASFPSFNAMLQLQKVVAGCITPGRLASDWVCSIND